MNRQNNEIIRYLSLAVLGVVAAACASTHRSETTAISASSNENSQTQQKRSATLALTHVTIIDVASGTSRPDQTIIIDGEKIVAVGPTADDPASSNKAIIEGRGKYVIPGLWDMHVHFGDPASAQLFVANGVTGVRVMWGNPRFDPGMERMHFDMRDAFESKKAIGPRMVIASQILDGPQPVWPNSTMLSTPDEARRAVQDEKKKGADFIKVYSQLPRDVYFAIADESQKQGIAFEGHVPEAVSVAEASDAKQRSIEHLYGMSVACSSKETELRKRQANFAKATHSAAEWSQFIRAQATTAMATYDQKHADVLFAKLIKNETYQCPTLTVLNSIATLDDPSRAADPRLAYVSEYMKKGWDPKMDFRLKNYTAKDYAFKRAAFEKELAIVGAMHKAGVQLLAGTDEINPFCFAGFSLHDELALFVKAGLTPAEALRTATLNPAQFLGQEATQGTIAEGKLADLVLLDANPLEDISNTKKISAVISRGVMYRRPALDKMLEEVKDAVAQPRWGGDASAH